MSNGHLSLVEEEHLPFLFRKLHSLAPKWYGFCLQLGVKELDQIQSNGTSVDDCFVLALQKWLKDGKSCKWKQLITAISNPAGGGNQLLASDVAKSFQGITPNQHSVISFIHANVYHSAFVVFVITIHSVLFPIRDVYIQAQ